MHFNAYIDNYSINVLPYVTIYWEFGEFGGNLWLVVFLFYDFPLLTLPTVPPLP